MTAFKVWLFFVFVSLPLLLAKRVPSVNKHTHIHSCMELGKLKDCKISEIHAPLRCHRLIQTIYFATQHCECLCAQLDGNSWSADDPNAYNKLAL